MMIEPCCCDRQLPKELQGRKAMFQTQGDVTVQKLMKAVGAMMKNGYTLTLVLPSVDVSLLRKLKLYLQRGWAGRLMLMTASDQSEAVGAELKDWADRVTYGFDSDGGTVGCEMIGFTEEGDGMYAAVVQGPMLLKTAAGLKLYAGWHGKKQGKAGCETLAAVWALIRARTVETPSKRADAEDGPAGETAGTAAGLSLAATTTDERNGTETGAVADAGSSE